MNQIFFIEKPTLDGFSMTRQGQNFAFSQDTESFLTVSQRPYGSYAEQFQKRNLFEPFFTQPKQVRNVSENSVKINSLKIDKVFKLVGIVFNPSAEAVIEDLESQETFFLSTGQLLRDMVVEEILEDRVIFNHDGKRKELRK